VSFGDEAEQRHAARIDGRSLAQTPRDQVLETVLELIDRSAQPVLAPQRPL